MRWIDQVRGDVQIDIEEDDEYSVEALIRSACQRGIGEREQTHSQKNHNIIFNLESKDRLEVHESHGPLSTC